MEEKITTKKVRRLVELGFMSGLSFMTGLVILMKFVEDLHSWHNFIFGLIFIFMSFSLSFMVERKIKRLINAKNVTNQ